MSFYNFEDKDIEKAIDLAVFSHMSIKRNTGEYYIFHPVNVFCYALKKNYSKDILILAILHDVVENTCNIEYVSNFIEENFSKYTKDIFLLTKSDKIEYNEYMSGLNSNCLLVKLCDIYDNITDSPTELQFKKYLKAINFIEDRIKIENDSIKSEYKHLITRIKNLSENTVKKITLQKVLERKIKMQYLMQERINLREETNNLIEIFLGLIDEALGENGKIEDNFSVSLLINFGEIEYEFINGSIKKEGTKSFEFNSFFKENLEDFISLEFIGKKWSEGKLIDGYINFDERDNEIDLIIELNLPDYDYYVDNKQMIKKRIKGTFIHEMQHVIQKIYFQKSLDVEAIKSIESHIRDKDEIDARVEEVLSYIDEEDERDVLKFKKELEEYCHDYLKRNNVEENTENYRELFIEFINLHLSHYREKLGIIKKNDGI